MSGDSLPVMRDVAISVPGGEINVWHRPADDHSETVVLVHGLTGNSRWFRRVIDRLPVRLGIVAVDVRGRGGSGSAPPPFDLVTLADDIAICLDQLGVGKATIVGYSMGAWITAIFANRHPDRVTRLVLLDGGLSGPSEPESDPDAIIAAMVGPSLARLDISFDDEEAFFDYWKSHPALAAHWEEEMRAALDHELLPAPAGMRVSVSPVAVRQAAHQITVDPETKDAGAEVTVPTLLIVVERGTADQPGGMTSLQTAEAAAARNPNLTIRYLEDLNHYTLVLGNGARKVADTISGG